MVKSLLKILSFAAQEYFLVLNSWWFSLLFICRLTVCAESYGGGLRSYGKSYLKVHPKGKLFVGNGLVLRSAFSSNTIGLKQRCYLSVGRSGRLEIGSECGFSGAVVNAENSVTIGDRVMLGANVTVADSDRHPLDPRERYLGNGGATAPIVIESDVWVGMNSVVLKGVRIGSGSVVGANSVVVEDVPPGVIVVGSPAKVVRKVEVVCENSLLTNLL
jgi:acetyltransferase-like isoleucine patch superfamily enzyme